MQVVLYVVLREESVTIPNRQLFIDFQNYDLV